MKTQYIKRTTLLNRRYGWTETSIKKFLPEPDKRTTYHRTGNTGYSYTLERVQNIENTQEFQDWALKHCGTPENHKNNKPTKKERKQLKKQRKTQNKERKSAQEQAALATLQKTQIQLPNYPTEHTFYTELITKYNDHLNYIYATTGKIIGDDIDKETDNQQEINKKLINYILENETTYTPNIKNTQKTLGTKRTINLIQKTHQQQIQNKYPWTK